MLQLLLRLLRGGVCITHRGMSDAYLLQAWDSRFRSQCSYFSAYPVILHGRTILDGHGTEALECDI